MSPEPSPSQRRYRAVIFDLDGVLVDSEPIHFEALNEILSQEGITLTEEENQEFLALPANEVWGRLAGRYALRGQVEEYLQRYEKEVMHAFQKPLKSPPFLPDLLHTLQSKGIALAVASSSRREWIEKILTTLNLREYFAVIVSSDDVQRGKPDPEVYLSAAQRLGIHPQECLAVEDAPNGVLSAKRAGMDVAVVQAFSPHSGPIRQADFTVGSLLDILALVTPSQELPPASGGR